MFEIIHKWATDSVNTPYGLWVAGGLMALESMIAPVPSEFVMPAARQRAGQPSPTSPGRPPLSRPPPAALWAPLSATFGYFGGKPLVMKVGRYLLVNEHHLT